MLIGKLLYYMSKSSYQFYAISYYIKWVTTSWTYRIYNIRSGVGFYIRLLNPRVFFAVSLSKGYVKLMMVR